jgi:hypothetical protein
MISLLRKYEVWWFLGLIVVVNAAFMSGIGFHILPEKLYQLGRFALLAGVLGSVVIAARGTEGIMDLLRPMLEWRRSPKWYLFAFLYNPILCLIILAVLYALRPSGMPKFEPDFVIATNPYIIRTVLISSFVGEIVWISYAIRRLSTGFTPYMSAMIVGVVWTAWWVPMVFYNIGIVPDLPLAALLFNQMGIAAMCTFVYMHTKSGLLVLCLQLTFNFTILILPVTPAVGGFITYWTFAVTYFTTALLMFAIFGPKPLFGMRPNDEGFVPNP